VLRARWSVVGRRSPSGDRGVDAWLGRWTRGGYEEVRQVQVREWVTKLRRRAHRGARLLGSTCGRTTDSDEEIEQPSGVISRGGKGEKRGERGGLREVLKEAVGARDVREGVRSWVRSF
jgi:hypothetical protein